MNIFSARSIGLYSLAISGAIGFFQVVTSYGEANIKAPISISGNYLITAQNLPDCLQNRTLILNLQQSGIYLNGILVSDRGETTKPKDPLPTLSGKLQNRHLSLTGLLRLPMTMCHPKSQLRIVGSIVKMSSAIDKTPQLQGQIWLTSPDLTQALPAKFTGKLQPLTLPSTQSQSH